MFSHQPTLFPRLAIVVLLCSLPVLALAQPLPLSKPPTTQLEPMSVEEELLSHKLGKLVDVLKTVCLQSYPVRSVNECFDDAYRGIANTIDPHSAYLDETQYKEFKQSVSNDYTGVGIRYVRDKPGTNAVVTEVLVGTPAEAGGMLVGDTIVQVNDQLLVKLANAKEISSALVGPVGTAVTIHIARNNEPIRVLTLTRKTMKNPQMRSVLVVENGRKYGIIDTVHFGTGFTKDLEEQLRNLKNEAGGELSGLIFSVKQNPGGLVVEAVDTLDFFMDLPEGQSGVLERSRKGIEVVNFSTGITGATRKYPGDMTGGIPLVIMVGKKSASASEIVAGGLQLFNRATIAGKSGTFQKGSMQEIVTYRDPETGQLDGTALKITYAEYLIGTSDNWVPVQCAGVTPDILIPVLDKKEREEIEDMGTECENTKSIPASRVMQNAPPRRIMKDVNPHHWAEAKEMVRVFNVWEKAEMEKYKSIVPKK